MKLAQPILILFVTVLVFLFLSLQLLNSADTKTDARHYESLPQLLFAFENAYLSKATSYQISPLGLNFFRQSAAQVPQLPPGTIEVLFNELKLTEAKVICLIGWLGIGHASLSWLWLTSQNKEKVTIYSFHAYEEDYFQESFIKETFPDRHVNFFQCRMNDLTSCNARVDFNKNPIEVCSIVVIDEGLITLQSRPLIVPRNEKQDLAALSNSFSKQKDTKLELAFVKSAIEFIRPIVDCSTRILLIDSIKKDPDSRSHIRSKSCCENSVWWTNCFRSHFLCLGQFLTIGPSQKPEECFEQTLLSSKTTLDTISLEQQVITHCKTLDVQTYTPTGIQLDFNPNVIDEDPDYVMNNFLRAIYDSHYSSMIPQVKWKGLCPNQTDYIVPPLTEEEITLYSGSVTNYDGLLNLNPNSPFYRTLPFTSYPTVPPVGRVRVGVCALVRAGQSFYLEEWLRFHIYYGVDHFILINHDVKNLLSEILSQWPEFQDRVDVLSFISRDSNYYSSAMALCISEFKKYSPEWIGFFGVNEFVALNSYEERLPAALAHVQRDFPNVACAEFRWRNVRANGHFLRPDSRSQIRSFTRLCQNDPLASLPRPFCRPEKIKGVDRGGHFPSIIEPESYNIDVSLYYHYWIVHYLFTSFEDWVITSQTSLVTIENGPFVIDSKVFAVNQMTCKLGPTFFGLYQRFYGRFNNGKLPTQHVQPLSESLSDGVDKLLRFPTCYYRS